MPRSAPSNSSALCVRFSRGRIEKQDLEREMVQRSDFIAVDELLTTRETLEQERRMISLANQGADRFRPFNPRFTPQYILSDEQRQAVQFILHSTDQFVGLRGGAGTGKTHLLKEVIRGIEEHHEVVLLTPTSSAVEVLRKEGLSRAATVQRFLNDETFQRDAAGIRFPFPTGFSAGLSALTLRFHRMA
jgi:chromosomal replication initiation ATPase DnaA